METQAIGITERQELRNSGTFDFCIRCPSHSNCCHRARPGGEVDIPLLTAPETKRLVRVTGLPATEFTVSSSVSDRLRMMKTKENGCIFYDGGRCGIYHDRPIDCRLFPMDLIEDEYGRLVLIVYTDICPVDFDVDKYMDQARDLLDQLGDDARLLARSPAPGMDRNAYVILGVVDEIRSSGSETQDIALSIL